MVIRASQEIISLVCKTLAVIISRKDVACSRPLYMHHVVETRGVKTQLFSQPIILTLMYLACSKCPSSALEKKLSEQKRNLA